MVGCLREFWVCDYGREYFGSKVPGLVLRKVRRVFGFEKEVGRVYSWEGSIRDQSSEGVFFGMKFYRVLVFGDLGDEGETAVGPVRGCRDRS